MGAYSNWEADYERERAYREKIYEDTVRWLHGEAGEPPTEDASRRGRDASDETKASD